MRLLLSHAGTEQSANLAAQNCKEKVMEEYTGKNASEFPKLEIKEDDFQEGESIR